MKTETAGEKMKNKTSNKSDKNYTPWYIHLIAGVVLILFALFSFLFYYYIIEKIANLAPSWG